MQKIIYLDNNATTLLDPCILQDAKVLKTLHHPFNPSSIHTLGQKAQYFLLQARKSIANYLSVSCDTIFFTSGATEGLNLCIQQGLQTYSGHVISSTIEHACVYETLRQMQKKGFPITFLSSDPTGTIDPKAIEKAIRPNTKFLIFSAANSETGVKNNIEKIAKIAKQYNLFFIVDAVAVLGKEKVSIPDGVSAMCFSGHKIHAPQGIGFVYIHPLFRISSLLFGGGQENFLRPGTQNLFGIVALEKAIKLFAKDLSKHQRHMQDLRDYFERTLIKNHKNIFINGSSLRIANTTNLSFIGHNAEDLLIQLDRHNIAASYGSACQSGSVMASRVLQNMHLSKERISSAIRFSLSRMTNLEEIKKAICIIKKLIK